VDYNVITEVDARRAHASLVPPEEEPVGGGEPAAPAAETGDDALDRLFKYIASLTIRTYLGIQGAISEINSPTTRAVFLSS
jgi:hypothetical protein